MRLVDFSTSRRVTVTMIMVAVTVFGMVGFSRLSMNLLPDIVYPTITIRTEYPGTAPAEVERLISEPIEGLVGVVSNVVRVSSVSRPGLSDVIVEFKWGTKMDFASLDIREKLDLVSLPQDAGNPILLRFDPSLDPILRIALYGGNSLMELRRVAEDRIRLDLESLEGVAAVRVEGGLEEEIHVEIETQRLDALGIPISQVTERLAAENVNLTGGLLKDGEAEFLVRTLNEYSSPQDMEEIVIAQIDSALIKLSDVGTVTRGHIERDVVTRINGREGVEIAVFKEGDANTVSVSATVRERLAEFQSRFGDLLGDAEVTIVVDQATFIEQSVGEVLNTAVIGGILAVLILFLFLRRLKGTTIISLSIPISVIATFFLMYATDVSLNVMSLGGLALGIGMLVDSSIVVLENVQRHRELGVSSLAAAREGTSEVSRAVIASTLTTVCVFVPIVFVEGVAGQLFRDQALTVTYSLLASLVVALMLIPMLSSIEMRPLSDEERKRSTGIGVRGPASFLRGLSRLLRIIGKGISLLLTPLYRGFDAVYGALASVYPVVLRWCLKRRFLTIGSFLLISAVVLFQARTLGVELIPEMSQGEFLVDLEWPAGTPLEETTVLVSQIDSMILDLPGISTVFSQIGASGQTGGFADEKKENLSQLFIRLGPGAARGDEEKAMDQVRLLLADVPALDYKFSRPSYFSFRTPIEVEITGYNLETLTWLASEVAGRMREIPGLVDVKSSAEGGQPEIQIVFDRTRVADLGTTIQNIGELLRNKLQGEISTELIEQDRHIAVRVRAVEAERRSVDDLRRMIISPASYPVPVALEAVAEVGIVEGPAEIRRLDQERVVVITSNLTGRDLGSVVADIKAATAGIALPDGFAITIGGQNEEMGRSFDSMKFALALAVFLVYLVMASQFESLLHPLVIMFTIPLGMVGSFLALLLLGETISVVVLIGLIMLAGIVVNNAIVLVDAVNQLRRRGGMEKFEAVAKAGVLRMRPILMTTSTTVLALLPMALGIGEGAEIRAPMAITVIGGLLLSTVLTLVVIPVVYTVLDRSR
ncbi:MAG: efflux RND transporter permease subunit [Candidatus Eisenbacteria bacterium]|uniref:Efflux RND transporter permease subunit n=1 Tax=Eiseniibacteriota bacterium TaxID=2212470 RepID=A0A948W387_UNCEI|nr:efflux RND transporter permease subunit [Candidatus Eisenbacteria bacterium]